MNSDRSPLTILATIGAVLAGSYVSVSVLLDKGNELGNLLFYAMIASGIMAVVAPRISFTFLLCQLGLLDGIKRLMVLAGNVDQIDLFWVLGIAPVTLGGIFIGMLVRLLVGEVPRQEGDLQRIVIVVALNALTAVGSVLTGQGIGGSLRVVANSGLYASLIFVVPLLFRDTAGVVKVLRFLLLFFVPIALYGVYQQVYGFQDFEIDYLKSGLSIEIKQLMADRVRAFSTLNSPTALGSVCGILAGLSFVMAGYKSPTGRSILPPFMAIVCGLCYLAGLVAATSRSEFIVPPAMVVAAWAFTSPKRTKLLYTFAFAAFVTLVVSSPWVLANIESWNRMAGGDLDSHSFAGLLLALGSYSDRLMGFSSVLLNPTAWTLTGLGAETREGDFLVHDPISDMLLRHGIIGLVASGIAVALLLRFVHRSVFGIKDAWGRRLAAVMVGAVFAIGVVSVVSGSRFGVYPINAFVWLALAIVPVIAGHDKRVQSRLLVEQPEADEVEEEVELTTTPTMAKPLGTGLEMAFRR